MFRASESGLPSDLRKLISRKLATAQDKCGRTILHRAILKRSKHVIKFIVENYSNIVDIPDNVSIHLFEKFEKFYMQMTLLKEIHCHMSDAKRKLFRMLTTKVA